MEHTFTPGQFEKFRVLKTFHLGAFQIDVRANTELDFDGSTLRYGGKEMDVPQLRGMIGIWVVPVEDQTTQYKAKPSGVVLHPADAASRDTGEPTHVETAFQEEAVVGSLERTAAKRDGRVSTEAVAPLRVDAVDDGARVEASPRMKVELQDEVAVGSALPQSQPQPVQKTAAQPALASALVAPAVLGPMQQQLMNSGAYQKLSAADQEAVLRADAANAAALKAVLDRPVPKAANMGGNRYDSVDDDLEEGTAVGRGKFRLHQLDGQQGEIIRGVEDTGGAAVGGEGEATREVKGVSIFSTSGEAILQRAKPIGTPKVAGQGLNRALTVDQVGPAPAQMKTSQVTQVPAEGNTALTATHETGATGDVAVVESGDDLADLLPEAVVAGQTAPNAEVVAQKWMADNTNIHWITRSKAAAEKFAKQPAVIEAICALETPGSVKMIRKIISES